MKIKGFKGEQILHDSGRSIIYRIHNEETGKPFILKFLPPHLHFTNWLHILDRQAFILSQNKKNCLTRFFGQ